MESGHVGTTWHGVDRHGMTLFLTSSAAGADMGCEIQIQEEKRERERERERERGGGEMPIKI